MRSGSAIMRILTGGVMLLACALSGIAQSAPAPLPHAAPAIAPALNLPGPAGNDALLSAKPLQPPHDKAALISLDGEVDDMMLRSIQRRIDIARKQGCTLIVFEMDTYGGIVTSAIDISKLIKKLPEEHLSTVAWVHDKAYSAGSMISAACQQIVMSSVGTIGDCAPIEIENGQLVPLPDTERAKKKAPVLQEFDDSADKNGYNKAILEAMVDTPLEVHEMHNSRTGETRFVGTPVKDKLLAEEAPLPAGGTEHPWQYVKTWDDDKQLLTVGADAALQMHLSSATVDNPQQLKAVLNITGDLIPLDFSASERATVFLTDWWIRGLLFVGMLIFAWMEFVHPGTSVFAILAILCLVVLVGAPFLTGLAQIWEIALIVVGLGIVVGDLLFFGTMGLLAVPGFILMAIGLVASFVPANPGGGFLPNTEGWYDFAEGLGVLVGGTFIALIAFYIFAKYLYLTPAFSHLQLAPAGTGSGSPRSVSARSRRGLTPAIASTGTPQVRDVTDRPAGDAVFVGAIGRASTDLRPAGKGRFGEHLVGVVSFGSFIPQDTEIVVIEISGVRIVVKPHTVQSAEC